MCKQKFSETVSLSLIRDVKVSVASNTDGLNLLPDDFSGTNSCFFNILEARWQEIRAMAVLKSFRTAGLNNNNDNHLSEVGSQSQQVQEGNQDIPLPSKDGAGTWKLLLPAQLPLHHNGPEQRPHYCWRSPDPSVHLWLQLTITENKIQRCWNSSSWGRDSSPTRRQHSRADELTFIPAASHPAVICSRAAEGQQNPVLD